MCNRFDLHQHKGLVLLHRWCSVRLFAVSIFLFQVMSVEDGVSRHRTFRTFYREAFDDVEESVLDLQYKAWWFFKDVHIWNNLVCMNILFSISRQSKIVCLDNPWRGFLWCGSITGFHFLLRKDSRTAPNKQTTKNKDSRHLLSYRYMTNAVLRLFLNGVMKRSSWSVTTSYVSFQDVLTVEIKWEFSETWKKRDFFFF